jgi:hypothetical protein
MLKPQIFDIAYIDPQFRIFAPAKPNHGTTSAPRTEFMRTFFVAERVRHHIIKASVKINIRSFQMDEQIAIAATYRAITAAHLVVRQGRRLNSKGDSAAMTTGSVRGEFLVGRRHGSSYGAEVVISCSNIWAFRNNPEPHVSISISKDDRMTRKQAPYREPLPFQLPNYP